MAAYPYVVQHDASDHDGFGPQSTNTMHETPQYMVYPYGTEESVLGTSSASGTQYKHEHIGGPLGNDLYNYTPGLGHCPPTCDDDRCGQHPSDLVYPPMSPSSGSPSSSCSSVDDYQERFGYSPQPAYFGDGRECVDQAAISPTDVNPLGASHGIMAHGLDCQGPNVAGRQPSWDRQVSDAAMMTRSTAPALLTPTSGLNEVMQPSWQEPHHEAHQAIPPEKRSSYSELTANVEFLAKLKEQSCSLARPPQPSHSPQQVFRKRVHIRRLLPALRSSSRSEPKSSPMTLIPMDAANNPHVHPSHTLPAPPSLTPSPSSPKVSFQSPADSSASGHQIGARNVKEPRRPSLACTFCRERKIACGRPPEGSSDLTCNQCARRSFRCEYVNEYRLGRPRLRQSTRRR